MKLQHYELKQRQSLSLNQKVILSKRRIREFYEELNGHVYVAFSGGKDSTVLLSLVRSIYPHVPAVFVDTGLEYPEIKQFVQTVDNVITIRPKMSFKKVIEKYGYPVISKQVSMAIDRYHNTKNEKQKILRQEGTYINENETKKITMGFVPKKYQYLLNAPFKISEKCCEVMKEQPSKQYQLKTKTYSFVGTMACDSNQRTIKYLQTGCNSFDGKIQSKPLSFWTQKDIWDYIKKEKLSYSKIYDMGEKHTGCMFCMFGIQYEKPNRFQRMKKTHPKIYKYCMDELKIKDVLLYLNIRKDILEDIEKWL